MAAKHVPGILSSETIVALEARRDLLAEQREIVAAAPRSLAEAQADIPKVIENLAGRVEWPVGHLAHSQSGFADLAHAIGRHASEQFQPDTPAVVVAWLAPEMVAAALKRDLAAVYETLPEPMTIAAKHAELAKLDGEIAKVEREIADIWWQAIDAGMSLAPPEVSGATLIGLSPA